MVCSIRSDQPMIAKGTIKKTRKRGRHEEIKDFLQTLDLSIMRREGTTGEMVAVVKEITQ